MTYPHDGAVAAIPCRWCSSLSLKVKIEMGTSYGLCMCCGGLTEIDVTRGPDGTEIRTRRVMEIPKDGEDCDQ